QQFNDPLRTPLAEHLSEPILVVGDAVLFDERNKVRRCVSNQRRFAEVWIGGKKVLRVRVDISEVATPAARDGDFLSDSIRMFQNQDSTPALAGFNRTKKTGGSSANHDDIPFQHRYSRW